MWMGLCCEYLGVLETFYPQGDKDKISGPNLAWSSVGWRWGRVVEEMC